MIIIGIIFKRRRRIRGGEVRHFISVDFNNPRHSRGTFFSPLLWLCLCFRVHSVVIKLLSILNQLSFASKLCHEDMEPEYTVYQNSPHARVKCADCHIGQGADQFVKSKISGVYQVYSVLSNKYSKPIPRPIKDLRPAQETCERCTGSNIFLLNRKNKKHISKRTRQIHLGLYRCL